MSQTTVNNTTDTIDAPHVQVVYRRSDKSITAYDKDDQFNEPAAYTERKRGLDKIWAAVQEAAEKSDGALTFRDVLAVFTQHGMPYHYWCRMD
jgi:hypothetical protein